MTLYQQIKISRYDVRTNRSVLNEYMERIKQELNPHYDNVHHIVYGIKDSFQGKVPQKTEDFKKVMEALYSTEKKI